MQSVGNQRSRTETEPLAGTVLITIDSLRADVVSSPAARRHAPTLSALRERGTTFENAFAHGNWTPFSFPSLLASRSVFASSSDIGLPESPTLAEALREAGITTGGINAANGFLTEHWGYGRGFDEFRTYMPDADAYSKYLTAHPTVQGWVQLATASARAAIDGIRGTKRRQGVEAAAADVGARAGAVIERARPPFFLWIHYMDAHTPYLPAPRHVTHVTGDRVGLLRSLRAHARTGLGLEVDGATLERLRSLYRAAIYGIDASVRGVLDALAERGIRDRTCVIVAGDHGEEFQEHGHLAHYPKLYEELIHVPLLVDHPDGEPRRERRAVGLDAVPPTVCRAMGVDPPETFEGESLLPVVRGNATPEEAPIVSVAVRGATITQQPIPRSLDDGGLLVSARTREWTYIYHTESGRRELYRRSADRNEERNVIDRFAGSEVTTRLHAAVERHANRLGGGSDGERPPSGVTARLKALGYR